MSKAERELLLRWRTHLDYLYAISDSPEQLLPYALGWLRAAVEYSGIECFSDHFWRVAFDTLWVVEEKTGKQPE
ncbi:hypothetical protein [Phaeodactylibacter xiamenensis]|uniref:hypothetical protein n=1 Tax=Phaeodactylibacter xiamenensis TaxID=1524460 RepID=UPI003CCBE5D9